MKLCERARNRSESSCGYFVIGREKISAKGAYMDVLENAVTEKNVLVEAAAFPTDDRVTYKDSTYEIVSKVAFLIMSRSN